MNKKFICMGLLFSFILLSGAGILYTREKAEAYDNFSQTIYVNPAVSYSYMSKEDIYSARKGYVENSIFNRPGYEPSNDVFGGIESGKPWCSINRCMKSDRSVPVNGKSEESAFINNPSVLVGIDFPYAIGDGSTKYTGDSYCNVDMTPAKVSYNSEKKEITVEYNIKLPSGVRGTFDLKGVNARDFGYKYGFVDKNLSSNLPVFDNQENITNQIAEFMDFLHLGNACGVPGGCNNGSPYQPLLTFNWVRGSSPVVIYLKLWREFPNSPYNDADMYEKIIIN